MIAREGYPVETHTLTTEDCYILEMHRIPHGKNEDSKSMANRPVVYLQHGLLCSSADWVMGSSDYSLGKLVYNHNKYFSIEFIFQDTSWPMLDMTFGWVTTEATPTVGLTAPWTPARGSSGSSAGTRWASMTSRP